MGDTSSPDARATPETMAIETDALPDLRGHNLACWCPLPTEGEPDCCHAEVLLRLANGRAGDGRPALACVEAGEQAP